MPELFAAQAARTPDATAVVFADQQLSYAQLDARANQLAHHLRGMGVGPEVVVGLCVERSLEMLVGVLGILKAGGAYLPLDPAYPAERLAFMLEDARAPVLLTQAKLRSLLCGDRGGIVQLDADWPAIARRPTTAPPRRAASPQHRLRHLHLGINRHAKRRRGQPWRHSQPCRRPDRPLCHHGRGSGVAICFTELRCAISEITDGLDHGRLALILTASDERGGEALGNVIRAQGVTHATLPPVVLGDLSSDLPLQTLVVAGEACAPARLKRLVGGSAHDQCLRPDRDDGLRDDE